MEKRLFTSECVTTGHPDKVADRISDSILDACLAQDPNSRVACETLVTTDFCCISGEITTNALVDYEAIARQVIRDIGYTRPDEGFCADTAEIQCRIHTQSPDIALGTNDQVGGAGDQGMMFGGACNQTPELMPLAGAVARALTNRLTQMVAENPYLRPDGKAQVTVEFDDAGRPVGVETVVVSIMHRPDFSIENLRQYVKEMVIAPVLAAYGFDIRDVGHIYINPTGKFVVGGPVIRASQAGRSLWTPMAAISAMAAARFPGRIPRRWTGAPLIWPGIWPRMWLPPGWQSGCRWSWPMPLAWLSRSPFWWTLTAPGGLAMTPSQSFCAGPLTSLLPGSSKC